MLSTEPACPIPALSYVGEQIQIHQRLEICFREMGKRGHGMVVTLVARCADGVRVQPFITDTGMDGFISSRSLPICREEPVVFPGDA